MISETISAFNGSPVYDIDGTPTIIMSVKGNLAKGFILNNDFALTPTFIGKVGDCFAHGETAKDAISDAEDKALLSAPPEERIAVFLKRFPPEKTHLVADLIDGHRLLTRACRQGAAIWVKERGIDVARHMGISEFCELTRDAWGGDIIKILEDVIA